MAIDPHVRRKLVTLAAFLVGGASLLAVGVIPSKLSRASTAAETANAAQHEPGSGLQLGLTGECGIDEPEPVAGGTVPPQASGSCGAAVAAPAARDDDERVNLDAVGQCGVAISALDVEHVPAELLLTSRW